ncbi:unnamed protein product [Adineta steineri]|uniref:3-hydroxyisobutyrate dehydrogenase n=1 Tax=Adineta steineri TaxID=433720 RepID=A0A814VCU7_9BILA|nr:unnamed protein product [Adineta steineri]
MVYLSLTRYASIGFFGLGNMGKHMVINLLKVNHNVTIFDTDSKTFDHFKEYKHVNIANKPEYVIQQSDFIILMLPNGDIVRNVCQSNIFPLARKGTFIIDCSTIDLRTSKELAKIAQNEKLYFIDAPVSGGVIGAQQGTLTFMVGCELDDFKSVKPILAKMGKNIVRAGTNGSGLAAKICNNLLAAIRLGLEKKVLNELINSSTGQCWSSQSYNPCPGIIPNIPSNNNYQGGFASELMTKDLLIALDAAKDVQAMTPLTEHATKLYQEICSNGLNKKDFSVVFQYLNKE